MRRIALFTIATLLGTAALAHAEVRVEEKSQVKFEGALGRMVGLFGGRAARDGVVSVTAVKGARKSRTVENTRQIVDLDEERIYDVDLKGRSYKVTTFADMRRQIEEARRKAETQTQSRDRGTADGQQPQMEVEFDLKESGQTRAINGFDAREVVMTITVHEKGKPIDQNGGMALTSHLWLAPKVMAMQEVADFERSYAQKLALPSMIDAQQMAAAMAMYPMLQQAMSRMQAENVNLKGTPVLTVTTVEAIAVPDQKGTAPETQESKAPTGLGGLGGRLARRALERNKDKDKKEDAATPSPTNRATVMTMQTEILKVTASVDAADLAVPAGFKQQ